MSKAILALNISYGAVRPGSITACENPYSVIDNIQKISSQFDWCFVINDCHDSTDLEFKYLPPHNLSNSSDCIMLPSVWDNLKSSYKQLLTKKHLSAVASEHNKGVILNQKFDEICVTGFSGYLDILSTCLSLIDLEQNVYIRPECIGDFTQEFLNKSLEYLKFLGVPFQ